MPQLKTPECPATNQTEVPLQYCAGARMVAPIFPLRHGQSKDAYFSPVLFCLVHAIVFLYKSLRSVLNDPDVSQETEFERHKLSFQFSVLTAYSICIDERALKDPKYGLPNIEHSL